MFYKYLAMPHKLLKRFIHLYRQSPCLWDKKCPAYKQRHKRREAISRLTELVHEHDPTATRVHVLRKIESIRACVRREHRKVQCSKATATCEDEVYVPHLWYYPLFSFVFDENPSTKPKIEHALVRKDYKATHYRLINRIKNTQDELQRMNEEPERKYEGAR